MPDGDGDPDNAFPAASDGSRVKATGFAGGYLSETKLLVPKPLI